MASSYEKMRLRVVELEAENEQLKNEIKSLKQSVPNNKVQIPAGKNLPKKEIPAEEEEKARRRCKNCTIAVARSERCKLIYRCKNYDVITEIEKLKKE